MRKLSEIDAVLGELQDTLLFPIEEVSRAHAHDLAKSGRNLISYSNAKGDPLTLHEAEKEGWDNVSFYWHKAIEKSPASLTHKGYDTTGVKAQFVINGLNRVLGLDGHTNQARAQLRHALRRSRLVLPELLCRELPVDRAIGLSDVAGRHQRIVEPTEVNMAAKAPFPPRLHDGLKLLYQPSGVSMTGWCIKPVWIALNREDG